MTNTAWICSGPTTSFACWWAGSPRNSPSLATEVKLPEERQGTCQGDFSNASWSWEQVLKPHMRKPDDPKTKIAVNYADPGEYATLAELGRKLQILESVAEWLSEDFAWKRPITLEMQQCGQPGRAMGAGHQETHRLL